LGCRGPLHLMTSSGGTITVDTAVAFPIQLLESGPAAGALVAALIGKQAGHASVVSFDMGGTTAKSCVIQSHRPLINKSPEVARQHRMKKGSGIPVGVPMVDLLEIGAGGGSIAELDPVGLLRVGPRSAGADPGPACYRLGGQEPTVTDANVVLGLISPDSFLGGSMQLDSEAACLVITEKIAQRIGLEPVEAAAAIHRVVTDNMAEATRVHSAELNVDLRSYSLVAYGGAGPLHAYGVAERLGLSTVVFPRNAGVLSATGLLAAPIAFEFLRSYPADLDAIDLATVNGLLGDLEIRLIAAICFPHIRQFRQHIDIGHLHHAAFVSGRIAGVVLELERRRVDADRFDVDHIGAERSVHLTLKGDSLTSVGVRARRGPGRLGVGDILRDDAKPRRLGLKPGCGDAERSL